MSDMESRRAQHEAQARAATPATSRRAQVWAGLMHYLSGEAVRHHEQAEKERTNGADAQKRGTGEKPREVPDRPPQRRK